MASLKDAVKGIGWMGGLTVFIKAVAILKIAVLARILTPDQFGAYGIALLVLGLLEVLTETGINIFLIQEKGDTEKYLNSAWVVSILRGFLIASIIILIRPQVMLFFNTPQISNLFYLIAIVALLRGFINPMVVTYQKQLDFMKVFWFKGSLYFLDAVTSIYIAYLTKSESSMLIGMIFAAVAEVFFSFTLFQIKPKFIFEKEKFLKVINAGKWITGAGFFSYLFQNIDNIIVGRLLGPASLGFYQQSYSIATLPVTGVGEIVNKVLFPVFVRISEDAKILKSSFYKSSTLVFLITFVFGGLLFIFTEPIVRVFLGERWLVITPTLKILSVFGVLKSLLNSTYALFLSIKMQKAVMISELTGIITIGITIYPLVTKFGTVGAAYSAIVAVLCSLPVVLIYLRRIFAK